MISEEDRAIGGQIYRFGGREPYTKLDGTETELQLWHSHCASCGKPFTVKITINAMDFKPNRRCGEHPHRRSRIRRVATPISGGSS